MSFIKGVSVTPEESYVCSITIIYFNMRLRLESNLSNKAILDYQYETGKDSFPVWDKAVKLRKASALQGFYLMC